MSYEAELSTFGIKKLFSVEGGRPRVQFGVTCAKCGYVGQRYYAMQPPPNQIAQHFRGQGWSIDGRKNKCPVCIGKENDERNKSREEEKIVKETGNIKYIATVAAELAKVFDAQAGRYKNGGSDEAVAKVCLVGEPFVAKVREEIYGPMKVDHELAKLNNDIETWISMGREMQTRLSKLMHKDTSASKN